MQKENVFIIWRLKQQIYVYVFFHEKINLMMGYF